MARRSRGAPIPRFAIIIGAAKAGTSSLYSLLAQHPELARCCVKEPRFFIRPGKPAAYYKFWVFDPTIHSLALEASTQYARFPMFGHVPERMAAFPAEFRLIYILRDPWSA